MHPAEEEVKDDDEPSPHQPAWITFAAWLFRWTAAVGLALLAIVIGQSIEALHAIDTNLAPHRSRLIAILGTLIAIGFVLFMGGIIRLILTTRQSPVIAAGVVLGLVGACALGIVAAPPGIKLLVLLAVAYSLARIAISMTRRILHTPSGRRPAQTPPPPR